MSVVKLQALIPSSSSLLATAFFAVATNRFRSLKTPLHRLIAVILLLNWRQLPFVWHIQLWVPVFKLVAQHRLLRQSPYKLFAIGKDPFEEKIIHNSFVGFDVGDWNGHLSNSSYGKILDRVRFKWLLRVVGPAMGPEKMWSPLAATSYHFLREVPMFVTTEVDVHIASWDEKWIYYVARFTTPGKTRSSPRILNCVALSRSCFKLHGSRLSIPPSRILSLSGIGPDDSNWKRTLKLRKEGKARDWLIYGGLQVAKTKNDGVEAQKVQDADTVEDKPEWNDDGMACYEERRKERLAIIHNAVNGVGWELL